MAVSAQYGKQPSTPGPTSWWGRTGVHLVLLSFVVLLAYHNSLAGVFLFDDVRVIQEHPSISSFWPAGPLTAGSRRPIGHLTFVANYRLHGLDVRGYHVTNIAIHLMAAWLLYGVVSQTLLGARRVGRKEGAARALGFTVALLWAVHPLQTESVTYIVQRLESLASLFYLGCLYCVIRGARYSHSRLWYALAVISCSLGMATKEIVFTAPLVVALYDRYLLSSSWREVMRNRWGVYAGFLPGWTWLMMRLLPTFSTSGAGTLGLRVQDITPWQYATTQPEVLLHYAQVALWPRQLCLDYRWPVASPGLWMVVSAASIAIAVGIGLWLLKTRPAVGFAMLASFLVLAPTSSIMPIQDLAVEHRMYLPLAGLTALVVGICYWLLHIMVAEPRFRWWLGSTLLALTATCLVVRTIDRNEDYHSGESMWRKVLAVAPGNARAHFNLGKALVADGRTEEAIRAFQSAAALSPGVSQIQSALGEACVRTGQWALARTAFQQAVLCDPKLAEPRHNLATTLLAIGEREQARAECLQVLKLQPDYAITRNQLGLIYFHEGAMKEALECFRRASQDDPTVPEYVFHLASAESALGQLDPAITHLQVAIALDPQYTPAHVNLGTAYEMSGKMAEAEGSYRNVLRYDPYCELAHWNLARLLADQGRFEEALPHLRQAVAVCPQSADYHCALAAVLGETGRRLAAAEEYRRALQIKSMNWDARLQLAKILAQLGQFDAALEQYRFVLQHEPLHEAASAGLRIVQQAKAAQVR